MGKLKLQPDPTFKLKVAVPVPGGTADVEFEFKYRDRKAVQAWVDGLGEKADVEVMSEMLAGWDLDDAFTAENIARLCDSYPGAAREAVGHYLKQLAGVREGN